MLLILTLQRGANLLYTKIKRRELQILFSKIDKEMSTGTK